LVIDKLTDIAYWATDRNTKLKKKNNNTISRDIETAEKSTVSGVEENIIAANKEEDTDSESEEECTVEELPCKFKTMQKRQKALEDFLRDYVVDMKFYVKYHRIKARAAIIENRS